MSTKYKFDDREGVYFITSTVVDWIDVFTRDIYRDILLDSFRFCQKNQNLQLHAWVLMPNHFHLICSFINNANPGLVIKNIKSFTAMKIIDAIIKNPHESRKEWMLDLFEKNGQRMKSNFLPILIGINSGNMRINLLCLTQKKSITRDLFICMKIRKEQDL